MLVDLIEFVAGPDLGDVLETRLLGKCLNGMDSLTFCLGGVKKALVPFGKLKDSLLVP